MLEILEKLKNIDLKGFNYIGVKYRRKSTDRDDLQQNSLEHQAKKTDETAKNNNVKIIWDFVESVSAKVEYKRNEFNKMIELCKTGKIDYIIIDEPKRLSRNNIDTSRVIDLMDKGFIKGILGTGRQYLAENSRDKFLLQLDLAIGKMDNEDRSTDVTNKMITLLKNGRYMGKAPFGYKNIGPKGKKNIVIDEENYIFVKKMFQWRAEGFSIPEISEKLYNIGCKSSSGGKLANSTIEDRLKNAFYIGIMNFNLKKFSFSGKHNHGAIIEQELFEKVNTPIRGYTPIVNSKDIFPLKGLIYSYELKKPLIASKTKGNVYYKTHTRDKIKLNISEKSIFDFFDNCIENYSINENLKPYILQGLREYYSDLLKDNFKSSSKIKAELTKLENKKEKLLNLYCDGGISSDIYKEKVQQIELDSLKLSKELNDILSIDQKILNDAGEMVQLLVDLSTIWKTADYNKKGIIMNLILVQLFVDSKKQLFLQEKELFELLRISNLNQKITMEVPSGFEPLYKVLQTSA